MYMLDILVGRKNRRSMVKAGLIPKKPIGFSNKFANFAAQASDPRTLLSSLHMRPKFAGSGRIARLKQSK